MICPGSKSMIEKVISRYKLRGVVPSQELAVSYDEEGNAVVDYNKIPARHAVRFGENGRLKLAFTYKGEKKTVPV